tara:strand:- start:6 stop:140 length:135 start_codon:yes stop_codon:yes gene_type:complete
MITLHDKPHNRPDRFPAMDTDAAIHIKGFAADGDRRPARHPDPL